MSAEDSTPIFTPRTQQWLLREMWLGCDGRWFLHVARRYGFEVANEINAAVSRSLVKASMRRMIEITGWKKPANIAELREIIEAGYDVYHPRPECEIELRQLDSSCLQALFHKCPVMERIEKGSGMENYRCACPLSFEGWMEVLELDGEAIIEKGPEGGAPCKVLIKVRW